MLHTHLTPKGTLALAAAIGLLGAMALTVPPIAAPTESYIVQGANLASIRSAVEAVGGEITHELGVIQAVGARLTSAQHHALRRSETVRRLYDDRRVETARKPVQGNDTVDGVSSDPVADTTSGETAHVTGVMAHQLHAAGITGDGVTVAVLDSGLSYYDEIKRGANDELRAFAQYDAIADQELSIWAASNDDNGHATHLMSVGLNSDDSRDTGHYRGVAPDAGLVAVKAFDADGQGSYADVIRGIDWLVANQDTYDIRVLNLSFSASPRSHYWDDPLNQAVMAAWQAGIVVVASAGNTGLEPMTIGVPGNVPYVITVGATTDNYTPDDPSDDKIASFSAAGPSAEGFVKPDVVAPGGHLIALMNGDARIALEHPEFRAVNGTYFTMSGTSQSAAVVTGVAALMLQADPSLSPDDVKCRLMASAKGARNADGSPLYRCPPWKRAARGG